MPPNILNLEFEGEKSNAETLKELLPTIEHYRKGKRTLKDIHQALRRQGVLSMAFSSFKNSYYSQRKENESELANAVIGSSVSESTKSPGLIPAQTPDDDGFSKTKKTKTRKISFSEELAIHQAQASAVFHNS